MKKTTCKYCGAVLSEVSDHWPHCSGLKIERSPMHPAEYEAMRQHAPSPDYSIYETPKPSEFSKQVISEVAERRIAFGIDDNPDEWYLAMRWRMAERAPA